MQRHQIDPDLASLAASEKLRVFLQSIREGGAAISVRDGACWRDSVKLEYGKTKGTA